MQGVSTDLVDFIGKKLRGTVRNYTDHLEKRRGARIQLE